MGLDVIFSEIPRDVAQQFVQSFDLHAGDVHRQRFRCNSFVFPTS